MLELTHNILNTLVLKALPFAVLGMIVIGIWYNQAFKRSFKLIRNVLLAVWALRIITWFINWDSGIIDRATGPYYWAYWLMTIGGLAAPVLLFHPKTGINKWFLLAVSLLSNLGLFMEHYFIILTSIHMDHFSTDAWEYIAGFLILLITQIGFLLFLERFVYKKPKPVDSEILDTED